MYVDNDKLDHSALYWSVLDWLGSCGTASNTEIFCISISERVRKFEVHISEQIKRRKKILGDALKSVNHHRLFHFYSSLGTSSQVNLFFKLRLLAGKFPLRFKVCIFHSIYNHRRYMETINASSERCYPLVTKIRNRKKFVSQISGTDTQLVT